MVLAISPEEMKIYRQTARLRWEQENQARQRRQQQAWSAARKVAQYMKDEFHVEKVAVFGSLVHPGMFHLHSDLDLAVWGLTTRNWLQAVGAARDQSDEIEINLVDVTACSPQLYAAIEQEGVFI